MHTGGMSRREIISVTIASMYGFIVSVRLPRVLQKCQFNQPPEEKEVNCSMCVISMSRLKRIIVKQKYNYEI